MDKIINLFTNPSYQGLLYFFLGSIVSFIASYVFYIFTIKGGKLAYHTDNSVVIDKGNQLIPDEFKIVYGKDLISTLVRTNIYFWNNGNKTIKKEDLVKENPLRVEFNNEMQIFVYNIVKNTDSSNGMNIYNNNGVLELQFNYLEPNNGVRIEILHNNSDVIAKIVGKVIDVRDGVKKSDDLMINKINSFFDIGGIIALYISMFLFSFSTLGSFSLLYNHLIKENWVMYIGLILFILIPPIMIPILLRFYSKSKKYPKILDEKSRIAHS